MTVTTLSRQQDRWVSYSDGQQSLRGYFVSPSSHTASPGVLIVHTWLGITESIQDRAHRLAQLGYAAFALDLFGPGVFPKPPQRPQDVVHPFYTDRRFFRQRLMAGLQALRQQPECQRDRLAAIGYCFGGCAVLELAREGAPLKGVVSFHGELDTTLPAQPGKIQAKLLVLHGDADPVVPFERVVDFRHEMRLAQADWEIILYSGAKHSFTGEGAIGDATPEAGLDPTVESRSWQRMAGFLNEIFLKR